MGNYSIKDLEHLSGIKAHTIRIWEKRHQIIEPRRTSTNIRYYTDDDLKKIINVSLLNNHGVKISAIAGLSSHELNQQVTELFKQAHPQVDIDIDQLIVGMIELDEERFEKTLGNIILKFGLKEAILEVIYPFLERIGVLWQTGNISPAQEHFISNLIRQKIIVAIDALPIAPTSAPRALFFLPEGELHELGLLFHHYLVKEKGYRTYYLGQSVPYGDLKSIIAIHTPALLVTAIVGSRSKENPSEYINKLSKDFPNQKIVASGAAIADTKFKPANIKIIRNKQDLSTTW